MNRRGPLPGAAAYTVLTFGFAVVWHVALFGDLYERLGYFGREPSFAMGFVAIASQGGLLAWLYPRLRRGAGRIRDGLRFALISGGFLWTVQVVAYAAKANLTSVGTFVAVETGYVAIQFAAVGLAWIYEPRSGESPPSA